MEKWLGKVALVTGASSGIGKATAETLVRSGMKVVGCARNFAALKEIESSMNASGPGEMTSVRCDVTNEKEVIEMFRKIEEKYGTLHVCVNNAGLSKNAPLLTGSVQDWNSMLAVNVIGLSICTREAVKMMEKHEIDDGHIIQIGSMSGHRVRARPPSHFYTASKFAVKALSEGLRQELREKKSHIRATHISPGLVETDFAFRMYANDPEKARTVYTRYKALQAQDVADAVVYAMGAPPRVDVNDILVRPTEQAH